MKRLAIFLIMGLGLVGCSESASTEAPYPVGGWVRLGAVSDGDGAATVFYKDHDGQRIFVLTGLRKGSVTVTETPSKPRIAE